MRGSTAKVMLGFLGAGALLVGLSGPAMGQASPPAGSWEEVQATLGSIQQQLDSLKTLSDLEQADLDGLAAQLPAIETLIDTYFSKKQADLDGLAGQLPAIETLIDTYFSQPLATKRFSILLASKGEEVRDKTTGLVWERSPSDALRIWQEASDYCANKDVNGQKGWSLPTKEQLMNLVDKTGTGVDSAGRPVKLPDGHPFKNVQSDVYWSATANATVSNNAWFVNFGNGGVDFRCKCLSSTVRRWCVRAG